ALQQFSAESPENARIAQEDIFGYQNSQKAIGGEEKGLQDPALMKKKSDEENSLKASVKTNAKQQAEVGNPWAAITQAMHVYRNTYPTLFFLERMRGFDSTLAHIARDLVRGAEERGKPNQQRLREYRESAMPSLEQELFSTAPIYKSLEILKLSDSLALIAEKLGN